MPDALLARLSIDHAIERADRAIVICTVDADGWSHPAMLSSLEVVAHDAHHIRLAIHINARSTRNINANGKLTLILADEEGVFYIKGDAVQVSPAMVAAPGHAIFHLRVVSIREDHAAAYENARITSGIRVARGTLDIARAEAVIRELMADP